MDNDRDNTQSFVALTKGTTVSHYRIVEKIGAGGMGEVYLAEDTELDRKVALKFLPHHLCQDEDCRARFKREAQAAAKLNHPSIVTIHEVSEYQQRPYFAMEHVEGKSLRDVIKSEEPNLDRVVGWAIQLCDGLENAHRTGITHRDIKPSNIVIDSNGRPKLLDFGLATVAGGEHLTKTGSTLGTVGYMSPEQIEGKSTDERSDLFSLGVVLYELITGQAPFRKDDQTATLKAVLEDSPEPLARYKAKVPEELQRIVSKLLEKSPSLRYQTAGGVISDLKRLSLPKSDAAKQSFWKSALNKFLFGCVIGVTFYVVSEYVMPLFQAPPTERKMLAVLPFENLGDPDDEYFADGITDEITSRLAKISGLGVISRTSSVLYKDTDKSLPQIADELGVSFILEGTIRWDKSGDTDRVRITPQLIKVSDNTHIWAENYGRDMSDIFAVQADIAARIAAALDVTLLQPEREALEKKPTENLDAYYAYLRGRERLWRPDHTKANYHRAVLALERATELDSGFALAYATLSEAHSLTYHFGYDRTQGRQVLAKSAVDRAAELQPSLAEVHFAYGEYYYQCHKDYENALREYTLAQKSLPEDYRITALIGAVYRRQGKLETALGNLEKALELNPRDPLLLAEIGQTLMYLRDFPAAKRYHDRSISISPEQSLAHWSLPELHWLWTGDLKASREALEDAPESAGDVGLDLNWYHLCLFERKYQDALDRLATIPSDILETQDYAWPKVLLAAECYQFLGKEQLAGAAYDSARLLLQMKIEDRPEDHRYRSALGWAYAGLHRNEDAIREGKVATELLPVSKEALVGPLRVKDLARIYVLVGEYEAALDEIDYLLSIPTWFTISLLRVNPRWDQLRDHPRFQELLEKYDTSDSTS